MSLLVSLVLRGFSVSVCGSGGRHALFPPKGEEEKLAKVEQVRHLGAG